MGSIANMKKSEMDMKSVSSSALYVIAVGGVHDLCSAKGR